MASPKARLLRRNTTDAERKLWSALRRRQLEGFRFRRQHPIGPFTFDLVCLSAKLVIEVDGSQHAEREERDAERKRWLESRGYRVLRFWNNEVLGNSSGVVVVILDTLERREHPPPRPPPQGGRE
jgi:very-short-patch-repair endonuclease